MTARSTICGIALAILIWPLAATGHVVILSPNGGEVFTGGDVVQIRWCIAVAHSMENWDIRYSTVQPGFDTSCGNVTGQFSPIIIDLPPTCTEAGGGICFLNPDPPCCMEYAWTIPHGIDSDEVKVKIRMDNAGTNYFDLSDGPFTIMPATSSPPAAERSAFELEQNTPNPFGPSTRISFVLDQDSPLVRLSVYDARGALVRRLLDEPKGVGRHTVVWHGQDGVNVPVVSGIYFYRLEDGSQSLTRKMSLVR